MKKLKAHFFTMDDHQITSDFIKLSERAVPEQSAERFTRRLPSRSLRQELIQHGFDRLPLEAVVHIGDVSLRIDDPLSRVGR